MRQKNRTMIYITQLIYLKEGATNTFFEFESMAIPIIRKYNGELLMRIRPDAENWIEGSLPSPFEVHLVSFATLADFEAFKLDEERKAFLHLKEQSIQSTLLIQGKALN